MKLLWKQILKVEMTDLDFVMILVWASGHHKQDSPVKSTFEETGGLGGSIHVSITDTTTNLGESPIPTIHENAIVIPPEVWMTKFVKNEVLTSGITMNISNMDKNVTMGEGVKQSEAEGTSSVETVGLMSKSITIFGKT